MADSEAGKIVQKGLVIAAALCTVAGVAYAFKKTRSTKTVEKTTEVEKETEG